MFGELSNLWWLFILLGVFAGLISGLLGIGGGVILVPALIFAANFSQKNAQGMSLAVMIPMALLGAFRYWQNPDVSMNGIVIALIVAGAMIGVFAGTHLVSRLPESYLRKLFAIIMIVIAAKMLIGESKAKATPATGDKTGVIQNDKQPPEMKAPTKDNKL